MNKQTALDWFVSQLPIRTLNAYHEEIVKALAMEREQIVDAYWNGTTDLEKDKAIEEGTQFYNETYGCEQ